MNCHVFVYLLQHMYAVTFQVAGGDVWKAFREPRKDRAIQEAQQDNKIAKVFECPFYKIFLETSRKGQGQNTKGRAKMSA